MPPRLYKVLDRVRSRSAIEPAHRHAQRMNNVPDFEQALAELETLVERLERGDLPLDEALKTFELGVELTRLCQSSLTAAQPESESFSAPEGQGAARAGE